MLKKKAFKKRKKQTKKNVNLGHIVTLVAARPSTDNKTVFQEADFP